MMQKFQLLHGGDYNPEQWLDRPDVLAQDIALMKKAHVNTVTLGVFSWSALEPQEGVFALDWLADIIHSLYDNGISTILATPSAARPAWMAHKYPEVRRVRADRVRELYNRRQNYCYTSPLYREKSASSTRSWRSGSVMTRLFCFGISPTKWAATATARCVRPRSAACSKRGTARWKRSTRHGTPGSGATITPTGSRSKALPRRGKTRCRGLHWTGSASSATGTLTS